MDTGTMLLTAQHTPRTILAGDFNAHHESWNPGMHPSQRTNHSQTRNLINRYCLDLANHPGTETRFGRKSKNKSVIDLTFSTPKLTNEIVNWCVDEGSNTGSDHAFIRFDIVSKDVFCEEISATARFNWKKADWLGFHERLQENAKANDARWKTMIATPDNESNLEQAATCLRDMILEAAEKTVPVMKPCAMSKRW